MTIPHLSWAEDLIAHIADENNQYASSPYYVHWAGVDGATVYENRTVCNNFVISMLKQGYGLTDKNITAWLGSTSPLAAVCHDAIVAQNGFSPIERISDMQAGDIIAIKYPLGLSTSGHMAILRSPPVLRTASSPTVKRTDQYDAGIFDSAHSGHGSTDTRLRPDGSWVSGAGGGVMRIYADRTGKVAGYTWSAYSNSVFYAQSDRHLVVGRYVGPAVQ